MFSFSSFPHHLVFILPISTQKTSHLINNEDLPYYSSTKRTFSIIFHASALGPHFWHANPDPCRAEIIIEAVDAKRNFPATSVSLIFHIVYIIFIAFLSNTGPRGFSCLIWSKTTVTNVGLTVVETETLTAGAAETSKSILFSRAYIGNQLAQQRSKSKGTTLYWR